MHATDGFVCANCFGDPGLVRFVQKNAVSNGCSFCQTMGPEPIAADINLVSGHFLARVFEEYDLAVEQLGWIGSEGGWIGPHWDAWELALEELGLEFPNRNEGKLLPLLFGEHYEQDWCEENAYGLDARNRARYSWNHFCKVVMHQRRYFFLDDRGDPHEPDVYSPAEVLQTIFDYAHQLGLFRQLPCGSRLVRARFQGNESRYNTAEELGPPPLEQATQPNRMSPAGIPMFYACDDEETALMETASGPANFSVGVFETTRTATLLDLTAVPPVPGLFDPVCEGSQAAPRRVLQFLNHITEEISRPIERGERVHVEYVPTQVVTEFVRNRLTPDGSRVDGVRYRSSVRPEHVAYVLFADQGNVIGTTSHSGSGDRWLRLIETRHKWHTP